MGDLLSALIIFIVTLSALSYIFMGDWAAGYGGAIALRSVLWPMLFQPLIAEHQLLVLVPLLLVVLLLTKALRGNISRWGNLPVGYLVGVGAAVAVGGAVRGTIFPQSVATMNALNLHLAARQGVSPLEFLMTGIFMLVGTVTTLAYFHFGARPRRNRPPQRAGWIAALATVGEWFIAIAFGALFAGVLLAAATALAASAGQIWQFFSILLPHG